jgi:hypothetical protein
MGAAGAPKSASGRAYRPFSEGMASYELKEINIEAKAQKKNQCTSAGIKLLSKRMHL